VHEIVADDHFIVRLYKGDGKLVLREMKEIDEIFGLWGMTF